jgi:hypothetical protein
MNLRGVLVPIAFAPACALFVELSSLHSSGDGGADALGPGDGGAPSGMILYLPFDDNGGTSTADLSGGGHTGYLTLPGCTWTDAGRFGNALIIDGGGVDITSSINANINPTGSFTVTAWFWIDTNPKDDGPIISNKADDPADASPRTSHGFQLDTTLDTPAGVPGPLRRLGFKLARTGSPPAYAALGKTQLVPGRWYFGAGVYSAETLELHVYLDGQLDDGDSYGGALPTSFLPSQTFDLRVGRKGSTANTVFFGRIDDVRMWGRALTAAEIANIYTPP